MATPVNISDPASGREVRVVDGGYLAVGPIKPSNAYNATLGVDDTPVTIVPAKGGEMFYITDIILTGNKNISTTVDATVNIYTATAPASATAVSTLLTVPIARSAQTVITGITLETEEGHFIVGKTSDDDVSVTILGYYV